MTNLDLRRQIAEAIGWVDIEWHEREGEFCGYKFGDAQYPGVHKWVIPHYESSLDALFRDVVPVAVQMGYWLKLHCPMDEQDTTWAGFTEWSCTGWNGRGDYEEHSAKDDLLEAACEAICTAFLALVKAAKGE